MLTCKTHMSQCGNNCDCIHILSKTKYSSWLGTPNQSLMFKAHDCICQNLKLSSLAYFNSWFNQVIHVESHMFYRRTLNQDVSFSLQWQPMQEERKHFMFPLKDWKYGWDFALPWTISHFCILADQNQDALIVQTPSNSPSNIHCHARPTVSKISSFKSGNFSS